MTDKAKLQRIEEFFDNKDVRAEIAQIAEALAAVWSTDPELDIDSDDCLMILTIGADCNDEGNVSWAWQSGDNSFSGPCYNYPYWGVAYYVAGQSGKDYADDIIEDLLNNLPW